MATCASGWSDSSRRSRSRSRAVSEVDDLIREARADARAAVKARLRGRFERELMEEAEKRPARAGAAKPTATPGTGLWVYCVAGGELPDVPPDVAGVAARPAPRPLRGAGLAPPRRA